MNLTRFKYARRSGATALALGAAFLLATAAWAEDDNVLSPREKAAGWQLLFDGKTTAGWRAHGGTEFPTNGWVVDNGCLACVGAGEQMGSRGGDLVTTRKFTDFELSFDWKISPGGNSGVKYFVLEPEKGRSGLGFEYQMLDDATNPDGKARAPQI